MHIHRTGRQQRRADRHLGKEIRTAGALYSATGIRQRLERRELYRLGGEIHRRAWAAWAPGGADHGPDGGAAEATAICALYVRFESLRAA